MSEFYKLRRSKITDALALLGFIAGFILPAYDAAQSLVEGFENPGQETQGLTTFVIRILGNAFAGGAAGLVVGMIIGWIWERIHKLIRRAPRQADAEPTSEAPPNVQQTTNAAGTQVGASAEPAVSRPDSNIRFDTAGFAVDNFLTLTRKVIPGDYDVARTHAALEKTVNIGGWDGDRLVGAVRVLTDGYLYSTIAEVVVDPEYRRRGIGRELMMRALDVSATGVVLFGSPPESAGFFERLGCHRAPSGYVLRRKKAATVRVR